MTTLHLKLYTFINTYIYTYIIVVLELEWESEVKKLPTPALPGTM